MNLFEYRLHVGVLGVNQIAHFGLPELIPQIIEFQIPDDDLVNGFGNQPHLVGNRGIGYIVGRSGLQDSNRLPDPRCWCHDDNLGCRVMAVQ